MSDSKSVLPKSPKDVIVEFLCQVWGPLVDKEEAVITADGILESFEENDIDVTWRPAQQAQGRLGDGE